MKAISVLEENPYLPYGNHWTNASPLRIRKELASHFCALGINPNKKDLKRIKKFYLARQHWANILGEDHGAREPADGPNGSQGTLSAERNESAASDSDGGESSSSSSSSSNSSRSSNNNGSGGGPAKKMGMEVV